MLPTILSSGEITIVFVHVCYQPYSDEKSIISTLNKYEFMTSKLCNFLILNIYNLIDNRCNITEQTYSWITMVSRSFTLRHWDSSFLKEGRACVNIRFLSSTAIFCALIHLVKIEWVELTVQTGYVIEINYTIRNTF